jgi:PIN domain nuclease of toxin-antitoxin system
MSERRFLVDTHIIKWAMEGDAKLPEKYQSALFRTTIAIPLIACSSPRQ